MFGVDQIEVADAIDDLSVHFFRHVRVEAAITGFHVIDGDLAALGHDGGDRAVGVTEDEHGIRALCVEHRLDRDQDMAEHPAERGRIDIEEHIGLAQAEILKKDLVQFVVVILSGMHDHVIHVAVERGHDPRQPDDLRARAQDGHYLDPLHCVRLSGDRTRHRIRLRAIEDFIGPEQHDHLVRADVGDVVRPARNGLDDPRRVALGVEGIGFVGQDVAKAKPGLSFDHQEFFGLGVMIVSAARDAGMGGEEGDLSRVAGLEHLDEDAARIAVERQGITEGVRRECAEIGGVEGADEAGSDRLGDQAVAHLAEGADLLGQCADRGSVDGRDLGDAGARLGGVEPVQQFGDDIVDVDQPDDGRRIVDADRQAARDVVTEGGDGGVVIRSAPFAEDVGQSVEGDRCACGLGIGEQVRFSGAFALSVGGVAVDLGRGGEGDRDGASGVGQPGAQPGGEVPIAGDELVRVVRAVDAGQMDDGIGQGDRVVQGGVVRVAGDGEYLASAALAQGDLEIARDEAVRAGQQEFHRCQSMGVAGRPATRSRMKSSFSSRAFMPATSRRSVLAEV